MLNHPKHIAVRNGYFLGKTFGSASTHNIYQDMLYSGNRFIFNISHCLNTQYWV